MKSYEVLYTKDPAHKKRKVFHDGLMKVEENTRGSTKYKVILYNDENKVIFQHGEQNVDKYISDSEVKLGAYQVQIEKENIDANSNDISIGSGNENGSGSVCMPESTLSVAAPMRTTVPLRPLVVSASNPPSKRRVPFKPQALLGQHSSVSISGPLRTLKPNSSGCVGSVASVEIDPQLERMMHPHQVVAANFLLHRLNGPLPHAVANHNNDFSFHSSVKDIMSSTPVNPSVSSITTATTAIDHDLDYIFNSDDDSDNSSDDSYETAGGNDGGQWLLDSETVQRLENKQVQQLKERKKQSSQPRVLSNQKATPSVSQPEFKNCLGAVLADEMGLGKSLVSIAVLWHFVNHGKAKGVIVCPSSLVDNWHKELKKWLGVRLNAIRVRGGAQASNDVQTFIVGHRTMSPVLIISYELFRKFASKINAVPKLEVIICDEGHRLKNAAGTQTTRALRACVARRRIVLTGSPIQNNLDELYSILQFVAPDNELGSLSSFKARLTRHQGGVVASAGSFDSAPFATADPLVAEVLGSLMIRRTQDEVLKHLLPPRKEVLLCVRLTPMQLAEYDEESKQILNSLSSLGDLHGGGSSDVILPGLQHLRQICNSSLSYHSVVRDSEINGVSKQYYSGVKRDYQGSAKSCSDLELEKTLESSSKLQLLDVMLRSIYQERVAATSSSCPTCGKLVIVSNFTSMLDLTSQLISARGWGHQALRLDGSVSCDLRQGLVDRFNRASDPCWLFLLAAKAGGVGLNLIGANRLIMLDCDWNPSIDLQAMARVWRQGQRLPVTIFRFVTLGKIEQSIMERQRVKGVLCSVLDCLNQPVSDPHSDHRCSENDSNSDVEKDTVSLDDVLEPTDDNEYIAVGKALGTMSKLEKLIAPLSHTIENESNAASRQWTDPLLEHLLELANQDNFLESVK